jgi:phage gp36-like protein
MYCTKDDLEKRLEPRELVALADDDQDGIADEDVVTQAIADADAEIDTYLRACYSVPLESATPLVRMLSAVMAIHNLYSRRRETVSEEHQRRYTRAVEILETLARGELDLGDSADDVFERQLPRSTTSDDERIFSRDTLSDF